MSNYDNTNTGILYRNMDKDRSDANPSWPDYKGTLNANGQEFWVSAWVKTGKEGGKMAGRKFFSISLKPKDGYDFKAAEQRESKNQTTTRAQPDADFNDDIPF